MKQAKTIIALVGLVLMLIFFSWPGVAQTALTLTQIFHQSFNDNSDSLSTNTASQEAFFTIAANATVSNQAVGFTANYFSVFNDGANEAFVKFGSGATTASTRVNVNEVFSKRFSS